jgi:5-hydroxyisourate hydrolase
MSTLSTHILDAVAGAPAGGVPVVLDRRATAGSAWTAVGRGTTDDDGRISSLGPVPLEPGVYRLVFDTDAYTASEAGFYPEISVVFRITEERHYHVPVLLSPFAYSTYRGS